MSSHSMNRERIVTGTLIVLLIVLWAGFVVHRAPRFPGSLVAGLMAIVAALLMVLPSLAYSAIKRFPWLRSRISGRISMGDVLTWHVYTGAVGATLALLHTGHRFESTLGMALAGSMLATALIGYLGRHLLARNGLELREKHALLADLQAAYNSAVAELAAQAGDRPGAPAEARTSMLGRLGAHLLPAGAAGPGGADTGPAPRAAALAEAIAEAEYSVSAHDRIKRLTALWLRLHIATAIVFYTLLILHVWAGIHFGLRWFQ